MRGFFDHDRKRWGVGYAHHGGERKRRDSKSDDAATTRVYSRTGMEACTPGSSGGVSRSRLRSPFICETLSLDVAVVCMWWFVVRPPASVAIPW